MEVCESGEQPPLLHWDRKLSELCEPADPDTLLGHTVRRAGAARGGGFRPGWRALRLLRGIPNSDACGSSSEGRHGKFGLFGPNPTRRVQMSRRAPHVAHPLSLRVPKAWVLLLRGAAHS